MQRTDLGQAIADALETVVVKGTNLLPFVKPDVQEVVARINSLSGNTLNLQQPSDFYDERLLIATLDEVARHYVQNAQVVATTSGGATGTLGLPGLAIDLPILVATTVGMVRRHAITYGFTDVENAEGDRVPLLVAFATALGAENAFIRLSNRVGASLAGESMERLLTKVVSEEMATRITSRWLARAVPMVSTVTGAALDFLFLREAGRRSMRHFRERHLLIREQIAAARQIQERSQLRPLP